MSLEVFLGSEKHPKPWMRPTPVKILPNLKERHAFTHFEHVQRFTFYAIVYCSITLVIAAILQLAASLYNRCRSRKGDDTSQIQRQYKPVETNSIPLPPPSEKYGKSASQILEMKRAFEAIDIWFTWYTGAYQLFCAYLVRWSLQNDCIDLDFGMDFEIYIPWVLEAMLVHTISMCLCVWFKIFREQEGEIQSPIMKILTSVAPFLSERFNLLRDWVTIGIYLTDGHPIAKVSAAIVFLSIWGCIGVLFTDPKLVLSMRLNYWPLAKTVMANDNEKVSYRHDVIKNYRQLRIELEESLSRTDAKPRCFPSVQQPALRPEVAHYKGWLVQFQLRLLCEMDLATQEHKVVNTIYGEIPQAFAAVLFVTFSKWSHFVIICLILYVSKVILLILIRPYVLCYLADAAFPWVHLKANDLDRILHSRNTFHFFCPWERRVTNALHMLKELNEGPDVAAASVRGVGRLLMEVDDDSSATMVAHFINMLREIHNDLPEPQHSHEGVKVLRIAIVETIMLMSEGIEEKDVAAPPIMTGGNLGYLPTGGDLTQMSHMVAKMHAGQHDVVKLLKDYGAWKQVRLPIACDSQDDLLVFLTDLEPDDVMAIAQIWQWKMERMRMATEPLVVFGADFADKDQGTVFEKKSLVAHLMLGMSRLWVLTPDEKFHSDKKEKTHPSAAYWEAKRQSELEAICRKIADFPGSTVHFYVMAPGKGNIDAILSRLKSTGDWPKEQTWRIQLYSGAFNMRGMAPADLTAMKEIGLNSDVPLLDAAKFPFFGGKHYHPWASSFTTFAPDKFPVELNLVAHPLVPAGLKLFNDEHNMGLVAPHKLHKVKKLTNREKERLASYKELYAMDSITQYCKCLHDDFSLFSKIDDFKKSTIAAFAYGCCDSPLADQLVFIQEYMLDKHPTKLKKTDTGAWVVSSEGHTSVDLNANPESSCPAVQPVLAEPLNEAHLTLCREKLQEYLLRHLASLHSCEEEDQFDSGGIAPSSSLRGGATRPSQHALARSETSRSVASRSGRSPKR